MISFNSIKPFIEKHGPTILTGLTMFGVTATAYFTHRADIKMIGDACEAILFTDDSDIPIKTTVKNSMRKNWKYYIPPILIGLTTMGCAFGANRWHLSKEGALAAAAIMYKTNNEELEKAFKEKFGEDQVTEVKKQISEAKAEKDRPPWEEKRPDKIEVWDPYTEQWLYLTEKDILWAEIAANRMLFNGEPVEYAKLIKLLGGSKKKTQYGDNFGWFLDDTFCFNSSFARGGGSIQIEIDKISKNGSDYYELYFPIYPYDYTESL